MREANAKDLSFLDAIIGLGPELGVYTVPGDGMIDYTARVSRTRRLFRLGDRRGGAGPEEGAFAALREEGRRPSAQGVRRERVCLTDSLAAS